MRIIEDNYKYDLAKDYEIEYICESCNSVFQYNDDDIEIDEYEDEYVKCPCCGHKCLVDEKVTEKNIEFPKSFYEFGGTNIKSVDISDNEITTRIKECIKWLKENPNEPFRYTGYGNMFLCVFNHQDEYYIMVAKNYFETSIDK